MSPLVILLWCTLSGHVYGDIGPWELLSWGPDTNVSTSAHFRMLANYEITKLRIPKQCISDKTHEITLRVYDREEYEEEERKRLELENERLKEKK